MKSAPKNWDRVLRVNGPRGRSVFEACPDMRDWRKVLYVGANVRRFHLYGMFPAAGLYVLEVWPEYCRQLRESTRRPVAEVIEGDVQTACLNKRIQELAPFDAVVWWHGPEHVTEPEAHDVLNEDAWLHEYWTRAIVLGVPWGAFEQEAIDGNAHQAHAATFEPEWFEQRGYHTKTVGKRDAGGHITAWRTC